MSTPNVVMPSAIEAASLFKDWVELRPVDGQTSSIFKDYQLIEREEGEWTEVDNREAVQAQHAYLKKYAAGEYLAHRLAYQNLTTNSVQSVIEDDGSIAEYRCQAIRTTHPGLVAYALIPTQVKQGEKPDIKIIFRGTKPSSWASVSRDLEPGGAGAISFAENRDLILEQINQIAREFSQGLTLTIAGHSLGGADAQNCTAALIDAFSQNHGVSYVARDRETPAIPSDCRHHLGQVERLRVFTYNAAGIPQSVAQRGEALVSLLADRRTKGEQVPVIESYNQQVGGDGVQQTGEAHLLSNVSGQHAKVDLLKAHIGSEHHHKLGVSGSIALATGLTAVAGLPGLAVATTVTLGSAVSGLHDTKRSHCEHLHKAPRAVQYESFSNTNLTGQARVHAALSNKSAWLNSLHRGGSALYQGVRSFGEGIAMATGYSSFQKQQTTAAKPATKAKEPSRPWYRAYF